VNEIEGLRIESIVLDPSTILRIGKRNCSGLQTSYFFTPDLRLRTSYFLTPDPLKGQHFIRFFVVFVLIAFVFLLPSSDF
jgi:hypothetical protein